MQRGTELALDSHCNQIASCRAKLLQDPVQAKPELGLGILLIEKLGRV